MKILNELTIFLILMFGTLTAFAQTTGFNYQGKLTDTGTPQSSYQMRFELYDALTGGNQIGATITNSAVTVDQGVFTVQLDFGANVFTGANRFLEIAVRHNVSENYTVLSPRQQINSSPYAIRTLSAAQADVALDANKLGGIDANQYVTTTSVGSSFIKNATTQQTGNFNINGIGIVGDSLGIGTTPNSGYKFDTVGNARFRTAIGAEITFASPNGESGMSTNFNFGRADVRFDGTTLKLVAGPVGSVPPSTNGIAITTSGDVGIGTVTPTSKLSVFNGNTGIPAIFGESQSNRGVWGKSFSSRGVYGESTSSQGVFGISVSGAGVQGSSTSSSGVYGETSIASPVAAGVFGKGLVNDSLGVTGESNLGTVPVGVYGITSNSTGFGVFARTTAVGGRALYVDGNAAQGVTNNGLVKAMITVKGNVIGNPIIIKCYNGVSNSSTGNCGFTVTRPLEGIYRIEFGFSVSSRFFSITPEYDSFGSFVGEHNVGSNYRLFNSTNMEVFTFKAGNSQDTIDASFTLIMF